MFRRTLWCIGILFFLSYGLIGCFMWFGGDLNTVSAQNVSMIYMLLPMVAVIITDKFIFNRAIMDEYGIYFDFNKWYLYALLIPFGLSIITQFIGLLMPGVTLSLNLEGMYARYTGHLNAQQMELLRKQLSTLIVHPYILTFFQGLMGAATLNAVIGFGQELGWRGFLYTSFRPLGFWGSSFLTGVIWGGWYIPLVGLGHQFPEHPGTGIWMMIAWCILISPLFTYIREKSGSIVATSFMQGGITGAYAMSMMLLKGGSDITIGTTGLSGIIVLVGVNVWIFIRRSQDLNESDVLMPAESER